MDKFWDKIERLTPPPAVRKKLLTIGIAFFGVLGFYGILSGEEIALWSGVIGTLLNAQSRANVKEYPTEE